MNAYTLANLILNFLYIVNLNYLINKFAVFLGIYATILKIIDYLHISKKTIVIKSIELFSYNEYMFTVRSNMLLPEFLFKKYMNNVLYSSILTFYLYSISLLIICTFSRNKFSTFTWSLILSFQTSFNCIILFVLRFLYLSVLIKCLFVSSQCRPYICNA